MREIAIDQVAAALDRGAVVNLGFGPGYGLKQDQLLPPEEFIALVSR